MWRYGVTLTKASYIHYAYCKKRGIRIINNVEFHEHTNSLFLKSNALKFMDLVEFNTVQIMYKSGNNLLPNNTKKKTLTGL